MTKILEMVIDTAIDAFILGAPWSEVREISDLNGRVNATAFEKEGK